MRSLKKLAVILTALCCSQMVKANKGGIYYERNSVEGTVQGYVMDAITRKPVTGVIVSISSNKSANSNKIQPGKEIQSDATGHFNISKLPAGEVTLIFEKKGYKLFKRDLLAIKEGAITKIFIEVQPLAEDYGGNEIWHPFYKFLD